VGRQLPNFENHCVRVCQGLKMLPYLKGSVLGKKLIGTARPKKITLALCVVKIYTLLVTPIDKSQKIFCIHRSLFCLRNKEKYFRLHLELVRYRCLRHRLHPDMFYHPPGKKMENKFGSNTNYSQTWL